MNGPAASLCATGLDVTRVQGDYETRTAERRRVAADWRPGDPLPHIVYTAEEDALWQAVTEKLSALHRVTACASYLRAADKVVLPAARIPQLVEVSDVLSGITGFRLLPAEGTVPARTFYSKFADGGFYATLYLRPSSALFHSPEPDVIHELVGHAVMLADPVFADLYRCFGEAARRATSGESLAAVSRVFWFTMETGVIREEGQPRAYGAAILSSVAELESFRHVELRRFDPAEVVRQEYDDKRCQPVLYTVDSVDHLADEVRRFLGSVR